MRGVEQGDQAAEGMPGQHIRRIDVGRGEQGVQLLCHPRRGPWPGSIPRWVRHEDALLVRERRRGGDDDDDDDDLLEYETFEVGAVTGATFGGRLTRWHPAWADDPPPLRRIVTRNSNRMPGSTLVSLDVMSLPPRDFSTRARI